MEAIAERLSVPRRDDTARTAIANVSREERAPHGMAPIALWIVQQFGGVAPTEPRALSLYAAALRVVG